MQTNGRSRLTIVVSLMVIFAVGFPFAYREAGDPAGALVTIVVAIASLILGRKGGIIIWVLTIPIVVIDLALLGDDGIAMVLRNWPGICGTFVLTLVMGISKNFISELWNRHQSHVTITEERWKKINNCFLTFDADPEKNIRRLASVAGELLGATVAMYNRYENGTFTAVSFMKPVDVERTGLHPELTFCSQAIEQQSEDIVIVRDLQHSPYSDTLPYVHTHRLQTYVGRSVRIDREVIGSLCILFQDDAELGTAQQEILGILTSAIAVEEKRLKTEKASRESEQSYVDLFNTVTEAIYILDARFEFLNVNEGALKMYGYTREELVGRTPAFVSADGRNNMDDIGSILMNVFSTDAPASFDFWGKRKNGEIFPKYVVCTKGKYFGQDVIIATARDLTVQRRMQEQLLQSQKLESIGTLTGGIAHDFNNLLAMILGSAEMLQRLLPDDGNLKKYADRIVESSQRGTSISRQLLSFTRPDQADVKPIDLPKIIHDLNTMLAQFFPKSISIKTIVNPMRADIIGDARQLQQALMNVAINGGDAMMNAGMLTIRTFNADPEAVRKKFPHRITTPFIGISISDTGIGMDQAMISKIFDPFFTTKERSKGTGLGLAIVHGIVKQHKGYIDVESVPGYGTTFTLYFPAVSIDHVQNQSEAPLPLEAPQETILLVDDERMLRDTISEFLIESGYRVHIAANGKEGLEQFDRFRDSIDLIITDLGMPDMGGEEFYKRLRAVDPSAKVIVVSGYLDGTTNDGLMKLGIRKVLSKPFRMQELQMAVRSTLDARESAHAS